MTIRSRVLRWWQAGVLFWFGGVAVSPAAPARSLLPLEKATVGELSAPQLAALSPLPLLWAEGLGDGAKPGRTRIVERDGGRRVLEVDYPAGGVGPQQTGAQWMLELTPRDEYTLEYRVRFGRDFDWVLGGKLPGLAGGETPSGGHYNPDGFTARYMWRPEGRFVLYLYWAGQASSRDPEGAQYAEDLPTGVTLERGREYRLRQRIRLNTPGQPDGLVQVWVDDVLVLDRQDFVFRVAADRQWQIDRFFFSTFHGGADASWAPRRDVSAQFSDFQLHPSKADS
jgi:hypothetical protein